MTSTPPLPFGALLRASRQDAGLGQLQLAEAAGLSLNAIGTLERGTRLKPHPDTVARLLAALTANGLDPSKQERLREAARLQREGGLPPASAEPPAPAAPHRLPLPSPATRSSWGEKTCSPGCTTTCTPGRRWRFHNHPRSAAWGV